MCVDTLHKGENDDNNYNNQGVDKMEAFKA
jgi:hypothetical protein